MPKPPNGVVERLNYIIDFFFDPCDAPFTLYVETLLPALLEAAILWYSPVPDEIFTAWARPSRAMGRMRSARKGTRGSKAGRKGPRTRLGRIVNFDVNEFIGKRIPGAELLGTASLNRLTFNLWRIFGLTQLLGLIWLVWEVVTGFWVRWFSLLYETEYCRETVRVVADSQGGGYLIGDIVTDNAFLALQINKQRGPVSITAGGGTSGVNNTRVVAGVLVEGDFGAGDWLEVVMWDGPPSSGTIITSNRQFLPDSGSLTISATALYPRGGTFGISLRTNRGLLLLSQTTLYVQGGAIQ